MIEKDTKLNQSVEKVFQIIEVMAQNGSAMRLQDIALAVQHPASTTLRMLMTLNSMNYVYQDPESLKYSLTLQFCKISNLVHAQHNLRNIIHPFLDKLSQECQESASLAIEMDMMITYIDVVECHTKSFMYLQRIGKTAPMHCTGIGKSLLLNYTEQELVQLEQEKEFTKFTETTITTLPQLKKEIAQIREQGYAFDAEECELGTSCVAAPIFDYTNKVVAGISVVGTTPRIQQNHPFIINAITNIAQQVSSQLAHTR